MLTAKDLRGICVLVPTPCKEGSGKWDATDSVDLEETARMTENLIQAGIGSLAACGTTGECAALLWEEKKPSSIPWFRSTENEFLSSREPLP